MAKTKAQMIRQLSREFEQQGYTVVKGPFPLTNDAGEVYGIADRRLIYTGQMQLPLPAESAAEGAKE